MKQFVKANRDAQEKTIAIISACKSDLPDYFNESRTKLMRHILEDRRISFKEAKGCYKGDSEVSFICHVPSGRDVDLIINLKTQFDQESVLFREILHFKDSSGGVYLVFSNIGEPLAYQKIGRKLVAVSERVAKSQDAYTFVDGQYFIVK